MGLQLYFATDNIPGLGLHWEEAHPMHIWADGYERAVELAHRLYRAEHGLTPEECQLAISPADAKGVTPERDCPHEEGRPEVLRRLGWAIEDERRCDTCGLAPMGVDEYVVCFECGQCLECGCVCEEAV